MTHDHCQLGDGTSCDGPVYDKCFHLMMCKRHCTCWRLREHGYRDKRARRAKWEAKNKQKNK